MQSGSGVWHCNFGQSEKATPGRFWKIGEYTALKNGGASLPFQNSDILGRKTTRGFVVEIPMEKGDNFYGFGLQFHGFNQTGRRRFLKVNSDPVTNTGESHAPVPFFVSSAGYGLLVDSFRYVTIYPGTASETGSSDQRRILIEIPNCQGVDLYFFEGPAMLDAVRRYNIFSGGGCLPPLWALGNWYRAYGGSDQNHVQKLADEFRQNEIPVDVLGLEPGWHSHSYSCSYLWNKNLFPEPETMVQKLSEKGFHVNLWEHVFVHPSSELYGDLASHCGDYEVWGGLVPDLADNTAQDIFSKYHGEKFVAKGITGFKLDECDNSDFKRSDWSFPELSSFPSGLDGEQMHSALGLLYQKTIEQAFRERGVRTLGQVRSSWALAANSPFVLYSDLYDHKQFIRALVNSGFSGLLWSPEVRACEDGEDLIRRVQTTVFSPQSLLNCWRIPNPPWFQTNTEKNLAGEEMDESTSITCIVKKFLTLRMSLIPYLYAAFFRYYTEGLPPLRALVLDYENDQPTHSVDDQYMLGDSLMIAPVFRGQPARDVVLPHGEWYDYWTYQKFDGSQTLHLDVPLETIPVFVKSGAILPLADPVQCVKENTIFDLTVYCFGSGAKEITLYEDDGISFDYESGRLNKLTISQNAAGETSVKRDGTESIRYNIREWKFIKE